MRHVMIAAIALYAWRHDTVYRGEGQSNGVGAKPEHHFMWEDYNLPAVAAYLKHYQECIEADKDAWTSEKNLMMVCHAMLS